MKYNATLASKSRVTIPANVRRSLGLVAGESVCFRLEKDNRAILEKNDWKQGLSELHEEIAAFIKIHKLKPLTDEELDMVIDASAEAAARERFLWS